MKYKIKYFGTTRMWSTMYNGTEILSYTLAGLIETLAAYKDIYNVNR